MLGMVMCTHRLAAARQPDFRCRKSRYGRYSQVHLSDVNDLRGIGFGITIDTPLRIILRGKRSYEVPEELNPHV